MPEPDLRGLSVVVVDDHEDTLDLYKIALEQCGARVLIFTSAVAAGVAMRAYRPHVLVSSLSMWDDGYALLDTVRDVGIPAITVTGRARPADRERALAAGFKEYLVKPVDPVEVCRAVARLAGRAPAG